MESSMVREAGFVLQKLLTAGQWRKKGREGGDYTEWDRQVGVVELPWSSIPPMPSILPCHPLHPWSSTPPMHFMLPCRPQRPDRCMLPCRPPHPDHHGQCSPGCPWHPCSICVARAGRVCRPTLHHGHAVGVVFCGSAKMSAPPHLSCLYKGPQPLFSPPASFPPPLHAPLGAARLHSRRYYHRWSRGLESTVETRAEGVVLSLSDNKLHKHRLKLVPLSLPASSPLPGVSIATVRGIGCI